MSINTNCALDNNNYYYITTATDSGSPSFMNATNNASLIIPSHGTIALGDNFTITAGELAACLKVMRKLAIKEYPEDFL